MGFLLWWQTSCQRLKRLQGAFNLLPEKQRVLSGLLNGLAILAPSLVWGKTKTAKKALLSSTRVQLTTL